MRVHTCIKFRALHRFPVRHSAECRPRVAVEVKFAGDCDAHPKNQLAELMVVVVKLPSRNKGRSQWRFIVGLSVLGLLIIASASQAAQPYIQ